MFTISSDNVMTLSKGDTAHFTVVVKNADGTPYTVQAGDVITFTVKKGISTRVPIITKTTGTIQNNLITILPSDTKKLVVSEQLPVGTCYTYDVQIKLADGTINTMITHSPFILDWEATESE